MTRKIDFMGRASDAFVWVLCKVKARKLRKNVKFGIAEANWDFLVSLHTRNQKLNFHNPMANVFGILTAIVLAVSAFVAFKNKARYETQIGVTQSEKDKLTKTDSRLTAAKEVLAELPVTISKVDAEVDGLTAEESTKQKANAALKAEVEEKTKKIASNKEQLDDIRAKTEKVGDLKELASKMRTTKTELAELTESISSTEATLAGLTTQGAATQSQIDAATEKSTKYANGESLTGMSTRIRSIYPNWGFVTLAAGNSSGVVNNSTLSVVRDGQAIASLLVTAVEANTASATIVPDSLEGDVTLMVGDTVVPGTKEVKK
jgi:predicted RNase H-like nuclease (RuvC/YqgF family)